MAERLFQLKGKVEESLRSGRERVEGMREPLTAESLEDFMNLITLKVAK